MKIIFGFNLFIINVVFVLVMFSGLSCKKQWLDIKSDKSLTVLSSLQDCRQLLDNYQQFNENTPGLGEVGSDGHYISDSKWDEYSSQSSSSSVFANQMNAYTWSKLLPYESADDWSIPYKIVFHSNLILEILPRLNPDPSELNMYNTVKGEALFYKSKAMYDLSQIYAEPYDPLTDSKFGLQIPASTDITLKESRKSVHDTYDFIVEGLNNSIMFLPLKAEISTRPSKVASWGLLSRIYLVMGNFENQNPMQIRFLNTHQIL